MATAKPKDGEVKVSLTPLDIRTVEIEIVGTSMLVTNNWSEKAKNQIIHSGEKKVKQPKAPRDPEEAFRASLYPMGNGKYGFPSIGFKKAMVRAGLYANEKMTFLRGAFHIDGELVEIKGAPPVMREDMVRVQMGTDVRWRGQFDPWSAVLPITYDANVISVEQIANLIMHAGFSVGVGEHRPEKDGEWGRFELKGK